MTDKMIKSLDALLEDIEENWETDIIQANKVWFARLVIKARLLRKEYADQRSKLVGQTSQE